MDESCFFFFSSRRRHTRLQGDWSSDVCSSDLEKFVTDMDLSTSPEVVPALSMPRGSATEAQCLPPNDSKDIRESIFDNDNYVTQMLYKMADQSHPERVQTDAPASSADNISTSEQSTPDHSKVRLKLKKYSSAMRSKLKLAIENVRDKEHNHTVELTATETPTHNSTTTSPHPAKLSSHDEIRRNGTSKNLL